MEVLPTIQASVTLLPELQRGRVIVHGQYCPHIVIGSPHQREAIADHGVLAELYQGVVFINQSLVIQPGETAEVTMALMYYPHSPYAEVVPGATFTLREGASVVGYGTVLARAQLTVQGDGPASGGSAR